MATATSVFGHRLEDTVLAAHPARFRAALEGGAAMLDLLQEQPAQQEQRGTIAVLPIKGPLFATGDWITRLLGWSDHAQVGALADELAADPNVKGVILDVDSPGGDVQGMFEAAGKLAALAAQKPVYAVANHNAYSAAYALASVAERVYVTQAGGAGSIGVVATHVDLSGMDAAMGVRVTYMTFGDRKVDGNAHQPLSDRARAAIQAEVDALGEAFVAHVAKARGTTPDTIRGQEAGTYMGQAAVDAGLADFVGGLEDAVASMREALTKTTSDSPFGARRRWLRSA